MANCPVCHDNHALVWYNMKRKRKLCVTELHKKQLKLTERCHKLGAELLKYQTNELFKNT